MRRIPLSLPRLFALPPHFAEPSVDEIKDSDSDYEISFAAATGLEVPPQQAAAAVARQVPTFGRRSESRWEGGGVAAATLAPAAAAAAAAGGEGASQSLEQQADGSAEGGQAASGCLVDIIGALSEAKEALGKKVGRPAMDRLIYYRRYLCWLL